MAVRIGGKRASTVSPNPPHTQVFSDMGVRARARIDSVVSRMREQREQSLLVDGTSVLIWRRGKGSRPCTCSTKGSSPKFPDNQATRRELTGAELAKKGVQSWMDDYSVDIPSVNPNDIPLEPEFDPDFADAKVPEEPTQTDSGWLDKVVEEGPFQSGRTIKCPVCLGASYVDSWRPYKGTRIVGDLSERTNWTAKKARINSKALPSVLHIPPGGSITWKLFIPKYFYKAIRSKVWNGREPLNVLPVMDISTITDPNATTPQWVPATEANINSIVGNGRVLSFKLNAVNSEIVLTHFEIIILFADYPKAHVPEVEVPYDSEFVDYNTTVNMELPVSADVAEGDIIAEKKHGRLWLATTISKKQTGSGKAYGSDGTFRTIHSTEVYYAMNVFPEVGRK